MYRSAFYQSQGILKYELYGRITYYLFYTTQNAVDIVSRKGSFKCAGLQIK